MKKLLTYLLIGLCSLAITYGQVLTPPQSQGFDQPFTYGENVEFVSGWWASEAALDTLWQETNNTHSGAGALAAIPYGEEESAVDLLVQTTLNMTGLYNATCSFWAATEETGGDKSVLLFMTTSINGGSTWTPLVQIGNGETFPNADTPYAQYLYAFHPSTNDQPNVILRFVVRSGERRTPIAKLLIDDVYITNNSEDTFKPTVISTSLLAADSIRLIFSEPVGASATVATNYTITPGIDIESIYFAATQDSVTLKYSLPLEANTIYQLSVSNVADLAGNVIDNFEVEVTYHVALEGLVITEIFYDNPPPEMNDQLEFIELYNATTTPISLEGLQLKEAIFSGPFPPYMLQPGEYWVMTMDNNDFELVFGFAANFDWMASNLANEGDYLALYPAIEHAPYTLDSVRYGISAPWPPEGAGTGASIELINALLDNSIGTNWVGATEAGGTFNGYTIYATPGRGPTGSVGPSVNLGPNGNRCGLTQLILDAGNPGSKYLWSTGEETQTITITQSGTYSVIVNNGIGAASDAIDVAFVPAITASATIPTNSCANTIVNFSDNSVDATSWLWIFGDETTSTDQNPQHTYAEAGDYLVKLIAFNAFGCSDTLSTQIEVYLNEVNWTLPTPLCETTLASFTDNTASAESWLWDFGDGSTSQDQNPTHTYLQAGIYNVSLTVTNSLGCTNTLSDEVTVNSNSIVWTLPETLCENSQVNFSDNSLGAESWHWDFGDGTTSNLQNSMHTYATDDTFLVSLTVTNSNGCSNTKTAQLTVNANESSWTLPALVCQNTASEFAGSSSGATGWQWDFGDGNESTDQNPTHTYQQAGVYGVSLTVTNGFGCTNTKLGEVVVNPNAISWTLPTQPMCTYDDVDFADNSSQANTWSWDFGDGSGSTQQLANHSYSEPGEYTVRLTVSNSFGCTTTTSSTILAGICVGLGDEMAEEGVELYPNPGNDRVTVQLDWPGAAIGSVNIFNLKGEVVMAENINRGNGNTHILNVTSLKEGLYLVRILVGNKLVSRKLIIKR